MGYTVNAVPVARRISTPGEMAALLREIKESTVAGILEQVRPDASRFATDVALAAIPDNGPWPDYLELRFLAPGTGAKYKLVVETYHGTGGTWGLE